MGARGRAPDAPQRQPQRGGEQPVGDAGIRTRYRDLLAHYGLAGQRINARQAHENGDAESSHRHVKTAIDQALLLRGGRDFASREEYASFLRGVVGIRNEGRRDRFAEEVAALKELPEQRQTRFGKVRCRVDTGSLIQIHRSVYSVHSRRIGEWVEARLYADRVEVWYADKLADTLPRLVGRDKHAVHYRHVIDSLVRKPGAFAHYALRRVPRRTPAGQGILGDPAPRGPRRRSGCR